MTLAGHLGVVTGTCITASGALITCDAHGTLIVWDGDAAFASSGSGGREASWSGGGPAIDALPGQPGAVSGSGGVRRVREPEHFAPASPRIAELRAVGLPDRNLSEPTAGCSARASGIGRSGEAGGGEHKPAGCGGGGIGRRHDAVVTVAVGEGGSAAGARPDGWPVARLAFDSLQTEGPAANADGSTRRPTHYGKQPEVRPALLGRATSGPLRCAQLSTPRLNARRVFTFRAVTYYLLNLPFTKLAFALPNVGYENDDFHVVPGLMPNYCLLSASLRSTMDKAGHPCSYITQTMINQPVSPYRRISFWLK